MLWKKLISATFFIEVFGISKVVSKVNWKPTGPEGSCVQPENMYLWILKGTPNERAPNEECWCVEMSGTQMAHGRSVSSYGELKDAFREEGGRKTVQEGGPEREQSGWGATETLTQNIKGALKLTQRPSPDGDRELAAKTREGKKGKSGFFELRILSELAGKWKCGQDQDRRSFNTELFPSFRRWESVAQTEI